MTLAGAETRPGIAVPRIKDKREDRRRHARVRINLLGRYMLADRREYPCQVIDMSPGGVGLVAPVKGADGERVICYLDLLGRIEGTIARHLDTGFALRMNVPLIKREKLADQLTWLANRHDLGLPEDRRHERIVPKHPRSTLRTVNNISAPVKIIDVSVSGAAMVCDARPPVGSPVTIGATPARVVRVSTTGLAVEFLRTIPAELFSDAYEL